MLFAEFRGARGIVRERHDPTALPRSALAGALAIAVARAKPAQLSLKLL
jgi:hypothetical protein